MNVRERNGIAVSKYCTACREAKKTEKKIKHQQTKGYREKTRKSLHKKAWSLFSLCVRLEGSDEYGMTECYSCGKRLHYKEANAGHYFHKKLDFDRRNVKNQCIKCNHHLSGNHSHYAIKLAKELGVEGMEKLELDANTTENIYSEEFYESVISTCNLELKKYVLT